MVLRVCLRALWPPAVDRHPATAGLPKAANVEGIVSAATLAEGLLNGIAQVFFQGSTITGVLFTIGLLVSSRVACAAALGGSFIAMLVAWGMGAAEPAIRAGAFGFNGVLTAIALVGVVFRAGCRCARLCGAGGGR